MKAKSIVVTGGAGFVGRYLTQEIKNNNPDTKVVVWDREGIESDTVDQSLVIDITDPSTYEKSLKELKPDWVVHLAAVSSVLVAKDNLELTNEINIEGTRKLLTLIKEVSPETKVLALSTADIYGQGSSTPLSELDLSEAKPRNPYSESKFEMEQMIVKDFNDMVIRVRAFPHIGPGQPKGFVTADFASQIADIEKGKQDSVIKVGNLEAERDFTDVRDVVKAYRLLLEMGKAGEVYHVASGKSVSIQKILDTLLSFSDKEITVEQDENRMRPSDIAVLVGDASKLSNISKDGEGWSAKISLEQSLEDILNWWRGQK